ncbi:hypothetical protein ACODM8_16595 [Vibrio ostreicida]|uniref:Uncharacterized protein n=1 Tax=Vibrio ostreicida TaxID=526588 RepID=A0ABT8BW25_9VIBR|nr:hypothetical protein [Vibrio ostreicida]MDN3611381.1 hypothetical protein [Vibrio ostreicida]NPD09316.1 hypothetical protein [Vibrio ostreicida]
MLIRYLIVSLLALSSCFVSAFERQQDGDLDGIRSDLGTLKQSIEQSQSSMQYERTIDGSAYVPEPEHSRDKPAYSYFTIESYDIYTSESGRRMIQALITNHSGGGVELKANQIKAFFGKGKYQSPTRIEQEGRFAQDETQSVTLYFGESKASILGLITRSY